MEKVTCRDMPEFDRVLPTQIATTDECLSIGAQGQSVDLLLRDVHRREQLAGLDIPQFQRVVGTITGKQLPIAAQYHRMCGAEKGMASLTGSGIPQFQRVVSTATGEHLPVSAQR